MKNKKFAIIGVCDFKYEKFLFNHWLRSLLSNINTKLVDIVIVDYGLSKEVIKSLKLKGVIIVSGDLDSGIIVNARIKDIGIFLEKNKYEQIIICDSGDIIFQADITHLFYENPTKIRAVSENVINAYLMNSMKRSPIRENLKTELANFWKSKKMVNFGFVIFPRKKFIEFSKFYEKNILDKKHFGPDQFLFNLFIFRQGFVNINEKYNFIPSMAREKFSIKKGLFLDSNNNPIPIVHNGGGKDLIRYIHNFGYGENFNRVKISQAILKKIFIKIGIFKA